MNPLYLGLELGAAAFFIIAGWLAFRRGRLPFLELVSAATFGLLLEEGDQLIFETYHYSPDFMLTIDRAPVVIGLTWAVIIAGAMRITDALGVRRRYAPVVDSVLAIMLDLAFDAVAIRMGLWTWRDIGPEMGWFGVPGGNFYAWLFVTFGFSLVTRRLRDAAHRRPGLEWLQLLVPIPAFAILLASIVPFAIVKPLVDSDPGGGGGGGGRPPPPGSTRPRSATGRPTGCVNVSPPWGSPTHAWSRPPTAARLWWGPGRAVTPAHQPSCSTRTTTCSRRWTRRPGTQRPSS